jgi:hypothetical protein
VSCCGWKRKIGSNRWKQRKIEKREKVKETERERERERERFDLKCRREN